MHATHSSPALLLLLRLGCVPRSCSCAPRPAGSLLLGALTFARASPASPPSPCAAPRAWSASARAASQEARGARAKSSSRPQNRALGPHLHLLRLSSKRTAALDRRRAASYGLQRAPAQAPKRHTRDSAQEAPEAPLARIDGSAWRQGVSKLHSSAAPALPSRSWVPPPLYSRGPHLRLVPLLLMAPRLSACVASALLLVLLLSADPSGGRAWRAQRRRPSRMRGVDSS